MTKLTVVTLGRLKPGKHEDGGELRSVRSTGGSAAWVFRFTVHRRRREMGLGPYPQVTLKAAREMASEARHMVRRGSDPIAKWQAARREAMLNMHFLGGVTCDCFEARKAELKGDRKAGGWLSPLALHILPKLGGVPIAELDQIAVRDTLAPIWDTKADTAQKVANLLNTILRHPAALGLSVDLQAVDRARALLGKRRHEPKRIEALPWQEVPAFYASLGDGVTELALRLLTLTGLRSAPVRFVTPDEFGFAARVWTIPAPNLKGRKGATTGFRMPLRGEAVKVVREALHHGGDVLLPGFRGRPISDMIMSKHMRD